MIILMRKLSFAHQIFPVKKKAKTIFSTEFLQVSSGGAEVVEISGVWVMTNEPMLTTSSRDVDQQVRTSSQVASSAGVALTWNLTLMKMERLARIWRRWTEEMVDLWKLSVLHSTGRNLILLSYFHSNHYLYSFCFL